MIDRRPMSLAPLAILRILFGSVMVISCVRFAWLGWIGEQYIDPVMHFPYAGFEWVESLGDPGMYLLFGVMTLSALGVALGAWYRVSSIVFLFSFTYVELIDKTYYLNHYYFVSIAAFLFCLLPAHKHLSIDVLRRPQMKLDVMPRWMLDVFKLQIGIVYLFAGIAKINHAWLMDAMPLRIWLPAQSDLPIIGPLMTLWWLPWMFAWAGMLFDCSVPFLLWNKRTRPFAYAAVIAFHVVTGMMFQIGVFPLVMIAMTLVFFEPGASNVSESNANRVAVLPSPLKLVLVVHFVLQILLPWRHLLYPGELAWTEDGYRFSWRVMLMEKAGTATFTIWDGATGRGGIVDNREFLNAHQEKQMAMQPDMVVQYARFLREEYARRGVASPRVTADVWVTLNGAPAQRMVDPDRDLASDKIGIAPSTWVLAR
ncbi:MAG: HTTM domain-containing protein [Candidatus Kapabacteria bacterium]|nr:HTTM domain-containing protein [Candidatus Kapabacteria bacterium]